MRSSDWSFRMIAAMVGTALALTVSAPVPAASAAVNVGSITGVVKDTGGVLLAGIVVSVIDLTGYGEVVVDEDVTDAAGAYRVDDIWADPYYKVRFSDPAGDHATEFFADEVSGVFATWVPVTAGGLTSGVDASLEPGGSISGRLTVGTGTPVAGGTVTLWWQYGAQAYARVGDYATDADGRYSITGVKAATYALQFSDPATGAAELWNDQPDFIGATPLVVADGEDLPGIDALLGGVVQNVTAPTISGVAQVGSTLTAAPGTWQPSNTTVTYRWVVGDDTSPADDPTGATYVPTAQDIGKTIRVHATGARGAGWVPASAWSAVTAPVIAAPVIQPPVLSMVNDVLPRIKGKLRVGRIVRVTSGAWTPYPKTLKFAWYAGGRAIKGATHQRLKLTRKQRGKRLVVVVTAAAPNHAPLTVRTRRTDKVKR